MKKLAEKPFALLGVHVGGLDRKALGEFMTKNDLPWRSFVDVGNAGTGPISKTWNPMAIPTFYVLDAKGIIRHKWTGPPGEEVLDAALDKLLREVEGAASRPGK